MGAPSQMSWFSTLPGTLGISNESLASVRILNEHPLVFMARGGRGQLMWPKNVWEMCEPSVKRTFGCQNRVREGHNLLLATNGNSGT
jgi:hypothetical protein